jgi:hypothetical protein
MTRKTLDALLSAGGLLVAAILLVAGGLLTWAHTFISDQVTTQLSQQQIFFPPKGEATANKEIGPYINKYAGKQLTNGDQAEAYADHFIAVHLKEMAGGQTYAQLSSKAQANPDDAKLQGQVQTMFRGETLRGLLLNAYAFGKMGTIALYASVVAFAGAALMLLLSLLGMAHLRRVSPDEVVLPGARKADPLPV